MHGNQVIIRVVLTILAIGVILLVTSLHSVNAELNKAYAYRVDLSGMGLTAMYVKTLNYSTILVVGTYKNTYVAAIVNVEGITPRIEDIYPLTGTPRQIIVDGFPVSRVAIGTDRGEILLLRVDRGRITKYVYSVLGSDFNILKMYIARASEGKRLIVSLVEDKSGLRYVYVLDEDVTGILRISPILGNATYNCPLPENTTIVDIAVLGVYGSTEYYFDSSYVVAILGSTTEEGNKTVIATYDLSNAPRTCRSLSTEQVTYNWQVSNLEFIKGAAESEYKVVFTDTQKGFVVLATIDPISTPMVRTVVYDYIGTGVHIVSAGTYTSGDYIVIGLSDGRVRVYTRQTDGYKLRHIYTLGSNLLNLVTIPGALNYTYITVSTTGIQVLRIEPYPVPVFRKLGALEMTTGAYIHGDVTGDLKLAILAEPTSLVVAKNINYVVENMKLTMLDEIMVRGVQLVLLAPSLSDVLGSKLRVEFSEGTEEVVITDNTILLEHVVPGVEYTVVFESSKPYIYNGTFRFVLNEDQTISIVNTSDLFVSIDQGRILMNIKYVEYTINITLSDRYGLTGAFNIFVDGVPVLSNVTNSAQLKITHGIHKITVTPMPQYERIYSPRDITVNATADTSIIVDIPRKIYNLRVLVSEQGVPVKNVQVEIYNAITNTIETVLLTGDDGTIETNLPYGVYRIIATHPQYYNEEVTIGLDRDIVSTVSLRPTIQTLITRFAPLIVVTIIAVAIIIAVLQIRKALIERMARGEII